MRHFFTVLISLIIVLGTAQTAVSKFKKYPQPGTVPNRINPRPDSEPFYFEPYAPTYEERRIQALKYTAEKQPGTLEGEIARAVLGLGKGSLSEDTVAYVEKRLGERKDCADFTAIRVMMALYVNEKYQFMTPEHYERLKKTVLGFKYWITEPEPDTMISWTENHQIMFHASEYLAGQLFADEEFINNGKTGQWHKEHARPFILKWAERRARWGFSEWDSLVYYGEDLAAVLSLAQFARENDVATAMDIIGDLMLFDMITDMYKGVYGTSHGRSYAKDVMSGRDYGVAGIISVLTGIGQYGGAGSKSTLALLLDTRYTPSRVLMQIAQDNPDEYIGFERHGIPREKLTEYGFDTRSLEDAPALWGMGLYSHPEVADLLVKAADAYNLWEHPFFDVVGENQKKLPRDGTLGFIRQNMEIEADRTLLGEVNKVTYRTPDYMLSAAQDYRAGDRGNQHHVWQATLSPDAVVFTSNPGSLKTHDSRTPCYWGGNNRLPRVAQYKNLAFIIYKIRMKKAIGERDVFDFTHAFFPKWAFEEVVEKQGWIFGRVGDGYIALYSKQPIEWQEPDSPFVHDAMARGQKNVWICQMGRKAVDGSFTEFIDKFLVADLQIDLDKLTVNYNAPGLGKTSFSWNDPLVVQGKEISLSGYKRIDNPYCLAEFDTGLYVIEYQGERLILNMNKLERREIKVDKFDY